MRSYESIRKEAILRETIFANKNDCKATICWFGEDDDYIHPSFYHNSILLTLDTRFDSIEAPDSIVEARFTKDSSYYLKKAKEYKSSYKFTEEIIPFSDKNILVSNTVTITRSKKKGDKIKISSIVTEDQDAHNTVYTSFSVETSCSPHLYALLIIYPNYTTVPIVFGFNHESGIETLNRIDFDNLFSETPENSDYSCTTFYNNFAVSKTEIRSTNIPSIKLDTQFVKVDSYLSVANLDLIPDSNSDTNFLYENDYLKGTTCLDEYYMRYYLKGKDTLYSYYESDKMLPNTDKRIFEYTEKEDYLDTKSKDRIIAFLNAGGYRIVDNNSCYYKAKYNTNENIRSFIVLDVPKNNNYLPTQFTACRIDIYGDFEYVKRTLLFECGANKESYHVSTSLYTTFKSETSLYYDSIFDSAIIVELQNGNLNIVSNYRKKNKQSMITVDNNYIQISNNNIATNIDRSTKDIVYTNSVLYRDVDHTLFFDELGLPININHLNIDKK